MKILNVLTGLAVLLTSFAFCHLLHRYFVDAGDAAHSPPFLAGMAFGGVVAVLSLIGGGLLIRRGR